MVRAPEALVLVAVAAGPAVAVAVAAATEPTRPRATQDGVSRCRDADKKGARTVSVRAPFCECVDFGPGPLLGCG